MSEPVPMSQAARIASEAARALAEDPNNRFAADVYRHARAIELQEQDVGKTDKPPHGPVSARLMNKFYGGGVIAQKTPHDPVARLRKPGKREARGLQAILSEMEATAQDMRTYRNADEKRRAEDIFAGLRWIDAAIASTEQQQ